MVCCGIRTHTDILYIQKQHTPSEQARVLCFHSPAADVLMNGPTNSRWQDGDLLRLFISGDSDVWSGFAFVYCFLRRLRDVHLGLEGADGTEEFTNQSSHCLSLACALTLLSKHTVIVNVLLLMSLREYIHFCVSDTGCRFVCTCWKVIQNCKYIYYRSKVL